MSSVIAQGQNTSLATANLWIRGPVFDLSLVTGGAFFTLVMALLVFQAPQLLPVFFWVWVVGFEGSHFWATFTRTYFDADFRRENKALLYGSLVFFAFPALALYAGNQSDIAFASLYGFFIFVWSLYHNARQHYGFMSIYAGKAGMSGEQKNKLVTALYTSVCFAQAHFLFNFKAPGALGFATPSSVSPTLEFLIWQLPIMLSVGALVYLVWSASVIYREKGFQAFMPLFYVGVCWLFYSVMFYFIAPRDQFVQSLSGVETLMLIAIMNSLFHNIQYHAIVFHYGQKRYKEEGRKFGAARLINKHALSYGVFALLLGGAFGFIVWNVGDWPDFTGQWTGGGMQAWAYVAFFGIIGHHFYLDQKIWRPSKSKELREYLK